MGKATLTAIPAQEEEGDVNSLMMQLHGVNYWRREIDNSVTIEYDDSATDSSTIAEALQIVSFDADMEQDDTSEMATSTQSSLS